MGWKKGKVPPECNCGYTGTAEVCPHASAGCTGSAGFSLVPGGASLRAGALPSPSLALRRLLGHSPAPRQLPLTLACFTAGHHLGQRHVASSPSSAGGLLKIPCK